MKNQAQAEHLVIQQYLAPEEAAKMMGIKASTLSNWRLNGNSPKYVKLGAGKRALIRYPLQGENGLVHYMESRIQNNTSQNNMVTPLVLLKAQESVKKKSNPKFQLKN